VVEKKEDRWMEKISKLVRTPLTHSCACPKRKQISQNLLPCGVTESIDDLVIVTAHVN